jgi:hypothetical protein
MTGAQPVKHFLPVLITIANVSATAAAEAPCRTPLTAGSSLNRKYTYPSVIPADRQGTDAQIARVLRRGDKRLVLADTCRSGMHDVFGRGHSVLLKNVVTPGFSIPGSPKRKGDDRADLEPLGLGADDVGPGQ